MDSEVDQLKQQRWRLPVLSDYGINPTSTYDFIILFFITVVVGYIIIKALNTISSALTQSGKGRKSTQKPLVLILGPCNSGKTLLFYRLLGDNHVNTVSSLRFNSIVLRDAPESSPLKERLSEKHAAIDLIDFPGHPRLTPQLAQLLHRAVAIIYMLDSTDRSIIKQGAEQLYDLLLHPDICGNEVPFLLVCNKSDLPSARTQTGVMNDVLREIEHLRVSRSARLEGEDEAAHYLGIEGKVFTLDDAPVPMTMCVTSVVNNDFEGVMDFLLESLS